MLPTRRSFLSSVAAGCAMAGVGQAAALDGRSPRTALKILVLGGTAFLGPPFVRGAVAKGHTVTLFNRGKTNPELFKELEQLRGDREKGDLEALQGRQFDAIVDTSGYVPEHVEATAKLFRETSKHYQFISSISVYGSFGERPDTIEETAAVSTVEDDKVKGVNTIRQAMPFYGALKARCEAAAEAAMPGRVSNIRPGLIVGPGDGSDRFTWWPVRLDRGGEVLAPGTPNDPSQIIDSRDLAEFMIRLAEKKVLGIYNAVGPEKPTTMAEVLYGIKAVTTAGASFTWVPNDFLTTQGVRGWRHMPIWLPPEGRTAGFLRRSNAKALAAGLTFRPLAMTAKDTLDWHKTRPEEEQKATLEGAVAGISPAKEAEVLAAWKAKG